MVLIGCRSPGPGEPLARPILSEDRTSASPKALSPSEPRGLGSELESESRAVRELFARAVAVVGSTNYRHVACRGVMLRYTYGYAATAAPVLGRFEAPNRFEIHTTDRAGRDVDIGFDVGSRGESWRFRTSR